LHCSPTLPCLLLQVGAEIVEEIIRNSATFEGKTEFSQVCGCRQGAQAGMEQPPAPSHA